MILIGLLAACLSGAIVAVLILLMMRGFGWI
jgi:hypothetical protein